MTPTIDYNALDASLKAVRYCLNMLWAYAEGIAEMEKEEPGRRISGTSTGNGDYEMWIRAERAEGDTLVRFFCDIVDIGDVGKDVYVQYSDISFRVHYCPVTQEFKFLADDSISLPVLSGPSIHSIL